MRRVVVLGRGGSGKTVTAERLGAVLAIPVIELDRIFWSADLTPLERPVWVDVQETLTAPDRWILDGDLGPHDVLAPRLQHADTVVLLDFSLPRCAWQALRRSRERPDFWVWVATWRLVHRRRVVREVRRQAPSAELVVLRGPRDRDAFLSRASRS